MPTFKLGNAAVHAIATSAAPLTGVWYGQLMKPSFVFDVKTHDTIASLPAGMEISPVSGYSAGGQPVTLSNVTAASINSLTIAATQWEANLTAVRGILIYYRPASSIPSEWIILGYNNLEVSQNSTGGIFRIQSMKIETAKTGAEAHIIPDATITALINEQLDINTATVYAMVLNASYTPSVTHGFRSSLTAFEVTGTGYTAGGIECNVAVTRVDSIDKTIVEFDGPIFTGTTITGQYVAFYERLGGAASADRVITINNWGRPYSSGGAAFPMGINTIEIMPSYPS